MAKVFFNEKGIASLIQSTDSVMSADIFFYQKAILDTFKNAVDRFNSYTSELSPERTFRQVHAQDRDWAFKSSQSPYTKNSDSVFYFENFSEV